jgi:hypothetical protein
MLRISNESQKSTSHVNPFEWGKQYNFFIGAGVLFK